MAGYYRDFLIVIILCVIGAWVSSTYLLHQTLPLSFWIGFAFLSVTSLFVHSLLLSASRKRPQIFVAYFMGTLSGKIFLSAIAMLLVGIFDKPNFKFTAIAFMIAYLLLTTVEIRRLIPLLRKPEK